MSRTGYSQFWTPAGSSSTAIRGLFLRLTTPYNLASDDEAIVFDTVIVDTDGIASGGGAVIPAGMDGIWEGSATVGAFSPVGGYLFMINRGDMTEVFWQSYFQATGVTAASFIFSPMWLDLVAGDVVNVWVFFGTSDQIQADSWMLMKYLGPTP